MSFHSIAAAAGALIALALGGCASVEPMAVAAPDVPDAAIRAPRCAWTLGAVTDLRTDEDQGTEGLHPVTIADLPAVVAQHARHVLGDAHGREVTLDVLKAYATTRHVSRMFVLALRAHVGDDAFVVRGQSAGVFWDNDAGDVRDAARHALEEALTGLVRELDARCSAPVAS
jgi:hypothetical protein